MKIATWNVNSVRRRLPILLDWLDRNAPDVMCLQETKVEDADFPAEPIRAAGYHVVFSGRKSYNGVATISRNAPERVVHGFGDGDEDRILQTLIDGVAVVNTYVPQGHKVGSDKYAYKLEWFARLKRYFDAHLMPHQNVVWLGDVNVAPEPIDVYHPDRRTMDPDFHIDARNAYKATVAWGFHDVWRERNPGVVHYSYWDYFRNSFENNWGWRIDHILATQPLAAHCIEAGIDPGPRRESGASDHTVVWADFQL